MLTNRKNLANLPHFNEYIFGEHNKKVLFFFAGMLTRTWLYTGAINRLVRHGYKVVAYDFHPGVVRKGDAESFLEVSERLSATVQKRIIEFERQGCISYGAFGVSMGTLFAIKVAAENDLIKKLVINLTYGSVAENVWTWNFIKSTKNKSLAQGYTMESLDAKLAPVSPIPNAAKLSGKKVLLYLSAKDKILRFDQSKQFKEALDIHGVEYDYLQNNKRGHILAGYQNMRDWRRWMDFLEK
ncbi:prolyl oligopeptidase family serine peptidase [Candidatus Saccharibacteria bacterium]|nr:MAG: prolyl oligopeptidase family serine peptidase [Candidatus Saccharibacteria bacterium]